MRAVSTFTRIYDHSVGLEYPATPRAIANVIASMTEAAQSDVPFKVLFRMDDGSTVIAKPKRGARA